MIQEDTNRDCVIYTYTPSKLHRMLDLFGVLGLFLFGFFLCGMPFFVSTDPASEIVGVLGIPILLIAMPFVIRLVICGHREARIEIHRDHISISKHTISTILMETLVWVVWEPDPDPRWKERWDNRREKAMDPIQIKRKEGESDTIARSYFESDEDVVHFLQTIKKRMPNVLVACRDRLL
jgi:hypothetical protein